MKINKSTRAKPIKLIKTNSQSSLFSFMDNNKKENKRRNLIPLSFLFKTRINRDDNKELSSLENTKETNNNNNTNKFPISLKNTSFMKYKSLSYKILPIKYSKIKLPKIQRFGESRNEIKDSRFVSLVNKYSEFEEQFKHPKLSIDSGQHSYFQFKINNNFNNSFKYGHISLKNNSKKFYSKLMKRIKEIKAL